MKKIESLTDEQKAKFPEYVEKWTAIGLSTDNSKVHEVKEDLVKIYAQAGLVCPEIIIHLDSPLAANYLLNIIEATGEYDIEDPAQMTLEALKANQEIACKGKKTKSYNSEACYGQHDASWLAFYSFFKDECGLEVCNDLEGFYTLSEKCGWFYPAEEFVIVTKKPAEVNLDEQGRLHSEEGYAIRYEDGFAFCVYHGVQVPDYVILDTEKITVDDIESEANIEVKRVKITMYGQDRYILESGAEKVHEDDWGILYKKDLGDDEPLVMVKVVNSTAEPDGTFKDYFIRVRPDVTTAHEAVASTFRLGSDDYEPLFES